MKYSLFSLCRRLAFPLHPRHRLNKQGCICWGGGWEGWTPRENFWPPCYYLKKRKGVDFLCTYALAGSSTSIAKTSTPLMKFDKYSPVNKSSHTSMDRRGEYVMRLLQWRWSGRGRLRTGRGNGGTGRNNHQNSPRPAAYRQFHYPDHHHHHHRTDC